MKKGISVLLALVLSLSLCAAAFAADAEKLSELTELYDRTCRAASGTLRM